MTTSHDGRMVASRIVGYVIRLLAIALVIFLILLGMSYALTPKSGKLQDTGFIVGLIATAIGLFGFGGKMTPMLVQAYNRRVLGYETRSMRWSSGIVMTSILIAGLLLMFMMVFL